MPQPLLDKSPLRVGDGLRAAVCPIDSPRLSRYANGNSLTWVSLARSRGAFPDGLVYRLLQHSTSSRVGSVVERGLLPIGRDRVRTMYELIREGLR